jgi:alpha-tubulin suppressor-like RCC1 family protein
MGVGGDNDGNDDCSDGFDGGEAARREAAGAGAPRPPIAARAAAGWAHSAVVSAAGELWVWGRTHDMRNILRVNRKSQLTSWLMGTDRSVDVLTPAPVEVPGVGMPVARGAGVEPLDARAYALQLRDDGDGGGGGEQLPAFDDRVVGIACSAALTGCFTESGRAFLFGDNRVGQCGNGIPSEREWNPVRLRGLPRGERITALSLGYQHGLVATASGRVYAWGKGDRGQLGIGGKRTENKATALPLFEKEPVRVPTMDELKAHAATLQGEAHVATIDAGQVHDMDGEQGGNDGGNDGGVDEVRAVVVVDEDGRVLGNGNGGDDGGGGGGESSTSDGLATQKRRNDNAPSENLVFTEEGLLRGQRPRAVDVGCGFAHSAALSSDGALYVWGKFMAVHLSDAGDRNADEYLPRKLDIPAPVVKFACGQFHTAALDANGRIWLVGMRSQTEVAPDAEAIDRFCPEPYEVPGAAKLNIVAMRGGWSATTLIDADGRLYEVSFNGIQGPSTDFENVFVRDIAPGFKHTVVVGERR